MNLLLPPALFLLRTLSRKSWQRMQQSLDVPARAQAATQEKILAHSAASAHGRSLGLDGANPHEAFARIEPGDYGTLRAQIEADMTQGTHHFSAAAPLFYERTSGSSGAAKYIPYNRALRNAFDQMFRIWAYDLLQHGLHLRSGKSFMSVSPPLLGQQRTADGTMIGSEDDTDYLGGSLARLLRPFLVMPRGLHSLHDGKDFKDVLVAALLAEPALEVVSVWNPGFFLILLDHIGTRLDALAGELRAGRMLRQGRAFDFTPLTAARINDAARAVSSGQWHIVWPRLQLISCWQDAEAARPAIALRARFPGVQVQGKGLLATEAPISVPLMGAPACVPLLDQVYLELLMPDGQLKALHSWRDGDEGEIVVTTPGGLLRYRLGDRVVVNGFHRATPCLQFLGRSGGIVDMVGEKLSETFLREILRRFDTGGHLLSLCPVRDGSPPFYAVLSDVHAVKLTDMLDAALCASPHYRIARELGQLGPLRLLSRPGLAAELHAALNAEGIQAGNIKEQALIQPALRAAAVWSRLSAQRTDAQRE